MQFFWSHNLLSSIQICFGSGISSFGHTWYLTFSIKTLENSTLKFKLSHMTAPPRAPFDYPLKTGPHVPLLCLQSKLSWLIFLLRMPFLIHLYFLVLCLKIKNLCLAFLFLRAHVVIKNLTCICLFLACYYLEDSYQHTKYHKRTWPIFTFLITSWCMVYQHNSL